MTVPTTEPALPLGPSPTSQAVQATIRLCAKIESGIDQYILRLSSPTEASLILDILNRMFKATTNLSSYITYPAFDESARAIIPGYTGSLVTDTQITINAMNSTANWVVTNIPKDANGWVLVYKWEADGTITDRIFQPAVMAPLVAQLNAIKATIG